MKQYTITNFYEFSGEFPFDDECVVLIEVEDQNGVSFDYTEVMDEYDFSTLKIGNSIELNEDWVMEKGV